MSCFSLLRSKLVFFLLAAVLAAGSLFYYQAYFKNKSAKVEKYDGKNQSGSISKINPLNATDNHPSEFDDLKLLFLGDIMLDRWVRQVGEKKGYDFIFEKADDLLKDNDLVAANLEGPITDNSSISVGSLFGSKNNYVFTFDPRVAKILKKHNINLVNLGNNHILNFGQNGLEQTEKYLTDASVDYFGSDSQRIKTYNLENIKIGFVCYNQFEKDAANKTLADIETAKREADLVVLYAHWGKEYNTKVSAGVKILAHQFIDAGADAIIGSHPHVVGEKEEYNGKIIYYSLGNFIFDQYFDPQATQGLAVGISINPADKKLNFEEYPVELKSNGQTKVVIASEAKQSRD